MKRWTPHWDVKLDPREEYFKGMLDALEILEQSVRMSESRTLDRFRFALNHIRDVRSQIELGRDGVKRYPNGDVKP